MNFLTIKEIQENDLVITVLDAIVKLYFFQINIYQKTYGKPLGLYISYQFVIDLNKYTFPSSFYKSKNKENILHIYSHIFANSCYTEITDDINNISNYFGNKTNGDMISNRLNNLIMKLFRNNMTRNEGKKTMLTDIINVNILKEMSTCIYNSPSLETLLFL